MFVAGSAADLAGAAGADRIGATLSPVVAAGEAPCSTIGVANGSVASWGVIGFVIGPVIPQTVWAGRTQCAEV